MHKKKAKAGKPSTRPGVCRDCGGRAEVHIADWYRAASPRCLGCGGIMDKACHVNVPSALREARHAIQRQKKTARLMARPSTGEADTKSQRRKRNRAEREHAELAAAQAAAQAAAAARVREMGHSKADHAPDAADRWKAFLASKKLPTLTPSPAVPPGPA